VESAAHGPIQPRPRIWAAREGKKRGGRRKQAVGEGNKAGPRLLCALGRGEGLGVGQGEKDLGLRADFPERGR